MTKDGYPPIVILTGAGISRESGLSTFRDDDGIWATIRVEDVATPEAFARNPEKVHAFYNARRGKLVSEEIEPNVAHQALVRLEAEWSGEVLIVTQNIDDLHERAGAKNLIHMHGELLKVRCSVCANVVKWRCDLGLDDACPTCETIGKLRPHVVWFGEMPFEMERIYSHLECCGLFISIGTSGNVYPAAGFVQQVRRSSGTHTAELNLEPSEGATLFAEAQYGLATVEVPAYVEKILNGQW